MSWLAVGPANAAGYCGDKVAVLKAPTTVASVCEELLDVRATGTYGGRMTAPKDSDVATSVESLAKKAGLPGLSKATAVLSVADLGGVAAAAGLPALPAGIPGNAGLPNVSSLPVAPDLPGLPNMPAIPGSLAAVPTLPVASVVGAAGGLGAVGGLGILGKVPAMPDASGLTGVKAPITLPQPAETVKNKITSTLPVAPKKALEAVPLPESKPVTGGISGLLSGLKLR